MASLGFLVFPVFVLQENDASSLSSSFFLSWFCLGRDSGAGRLLMSWLLLIGWAVDLEGQHTRSEGEG